MFSLRQLFGKIITILGNISKKILTKILNTFGLFDKKNT